LSLNHEIISEIDMVKGALVKGKSYYWWHSSKCVKLLIKVKRLVITRNIRLLL